MPPPTVSLFGAQFLTWRGLPLIPSDKVPIDEAVKYAAEDADITLRLAEVLEPKLPETGTEELFSTVEMPLLPVLTEMECGDLGGDARTAAGCPPSAGIAAPDRSGARPAVSRPPGQGRQGRGAEGA